MVQERGLGKWVVLTADPGVRSRKTWAFNDSAFVNTAHSRDGQASGVRERLFVSQIHVVDPASIISEWDEPGPLAAIFPKKSDSAVADPFFVITEARRYWPFRLHLRHSSRTISCGKTVRDREPAGINRSSHPFWIPCGKLTRGSDYIRFYNVGNPYPGTRCLFWFSGAGGV